MKITRLELFMVKPRWLFLKMHTDTEIFGWGEPIVEGHIEAVVGALRGFEDYLIGQDPRRIEHHWHALYTGSFYRGGPVLTSALSGVEQAMWDILGKSLGVPVYQLLGGKVRDRIRMYAHVGGGAADELCAQARSLVAQGYTALKASFEPPVRFLDTQQFVEEHAERFRLLRETVGSEIDLAVDFHGRFSPAMAKRMIAAIEPYYPLFVEEPCLPQNIDAMADIARSTTVPLASGERLFTKWAFRELLDKGAVSVVQPDLCHAGGIMEGKKIAAIAECYYASVAPHNPLGPISLAAALQLDACTHNVLMQEQVTLGEGYLVEPFILRNGFIEVTDIPGLGITIDEDRIRALSFDGRWRTPRVWDPDDGAVVEW